MSHLVIQDLPDSIELDREALRAISGGRAGERLALPGHRSDFFQNPLDFGNASLLPSANDFIAPPFN